MSDIIDKIKAVILRAGHWLFEVKPVVTKKPVYMPCKSKNKRPKKK